MEIVLEMVGEGAVVQGMLKVSNLEIVGRQK